MKKLQSLRHEIDDIDKQIVELFERRMNIASEAAQVKRKNNMPILNSKREEEVIEKNIKYLNNKELIPYLKEFFQKTMDLSKDYQNHKLENKPEDKKR